MNKLKLSAPWVSYYKKLCAMFGEDPDIKITYDEDDPTVRMYVDNQKKAEALQILLPTSIKFGSVTLNIDIIPANTQFKNKNELLRDALEGNPAFEYAVTIDNVLSNSVNYFVFKNKVVQYFNDDLGDINGNRSTLYQKIAKEIFGEIPGIFYCTEGPKEVGDDNS